MRGIAAERPVNRPEEEKILDSRSPIGVGDKLHGNGDKYVMRNTEWEKIGDKEIRR